MDDDVSALLAALPLITVILFTKNRRLWAWWVRKKFAGSFLIVFGLIVLRLHIFNLMVNHVIQFRLHILFCFSLPFLYLGLWEVDLIYAIAKLLGYRPSYPGELHAFHEGMPFNGVENPFILCVANFILLFPVFHFVYWCKSWWEEGSEPAPNSIPSSPDLEDHKR